MRHDQEQRSAIRRAAKRRNERAEFLRTDGGDRKYADPFSEMVQSPSLLFTITVNNFDCWDCGSPVACYESEDGDTTYRKLWRCIRCPFRMQGIYSTYIIPEWPGQ